MHQVSEVGEPDNSQVMTLELHFADPSGGFFDMIRCRHDFSLDDGTVVDLVRSGKAKWQALNPTPVVLTRLEFSPDEWRVWTSTAEYKEAFASFVAQRPDRTAGLSRVLGEFLGCDDVACGTAREVIQKKER